MLDWKRNGHIGALTLVSLLGWAVAMPEPLVAGDAVSKRNEKPAGETATYWTGADSAPVPMPLRTRQGTPAMPQTFTPAGPAGAVQGVFPGAAGALAPQLSIDPRNPEPQIFGGAQWYSYPPPHTRYFPRFGLTFYPHSTLGKLFFSDGFSNYVCSGAAVTCGNLNLVMTAGHCCAAGDGFTWYDNFLFVPACFGANCNLGGAAAAPFGVWDWEQAWVPTDWFFNENLGRDICFLEMAPNGSNQELHQVTGALGFAWNQPQPVHFTMTGWPAQSPFSGGNLVFEIGSTADLDGSVTPNTVGVGNFMTGGSSGGGWIKDYKQGGTSLFWNGLNSYKYVSPARPDEMYGPYVDTLAFNIWDLDLACR